MMPWNPEATDQDYIAAIQTHMTWGEVQMHMEATDHRIFACKGPNAYECRDCGRDT